MSSPVNELSLDEKEPLDQDEEEWPDEGEGSWDNAGGNGWEEDGDPQWPSTTLPVVTKEDEELNFIPATRNTSAVHFSSTGANTGKKVPALDSLMMETLAPLMDMGFEITPDQAHRLAHANDWKIKVVQNKLLTDSEKALKNVGIMLDTQPAKLPDENLKEFECPMCYDDKPPNEFRAYLNCGHVVCQDCWLDVVRDGCKEGLKCLDMFCPMGKKACGVAITSRVVEKILKDGDNEMSAENKGLWEKFSKWKFKSFIDVSQSLSYCPAADCDQITKYVAGIRKDIHCECGHIWCWRCKRIGHNPASCKDTEEWEQKYNDEGESVKWITVNTKKCPKCRYPIEKNQGCMHMTCRSALGCGHEFCWLCLGDWKEHGSKTGGFYKCTIYEENKNKGKYAEEEKSRQSMQDELERYTFHLQMYDDCLKSSEFAKKQIPKFEQMIIEQGRNGGLTNNNWDFITNALHEVGSNKRMCAFIYVMLYYMRPDQAKEPLKFNQRMILQEQQALLLTFSDKLQSNYDKNKDNMEELYKCRSSMTDLIRLTQKYRKTLKEHISSDVLKDVLA